MGISVGAIANIVTALASAAGAAHTIKRGKALKGEVAHAKKKTEAEARKKKEKEQRLREKSPGQRLLGGRPSLG